MATKPEEKAPPADTPPAPAAEDKKPEADRQPEPKRAGLRWVSGK